MTILNLYLHPPLIFLLLCASSTLFLKSYRNPPRSSVSPSSVTTTTIKTKKTLWYYLLPPRKGAFSLATWLTNTALIDLHFSTQHKASQTFKMAGPSLSREDSGNDKATINSMGMGRLHGKNAVVTGAAGCVKNQTLILRSSWLEKNRDDLSQDNSSQCVPRDMYCTSTADHLTTLHRLAS